MRLLLASTNTQKLSELRELLAGLPIEVWGPERVIGLPVVEEDAPDFLGNARKKAEAAARASGLWALADDSGLEVEALGGAPGVRSARFAGEGATYAQNNALLLQRLRGLPPGRRRARFVCALALASPAGSIEAELQGEAQGRILEAPRGGGGFGYDPLFLFDEPDSLLAGRCFAELGRAEKSLVSHRGRALAALRPVLERLSGYEIRRSP